jgi:adenylosuccinate lyase
MVQEHERDGRGWKVEWAAFPETCLLVGACLELGRAMLSGLEVNVTAMSEHCEDSHAWLASEHVLARLSPLVGKHRAQLLLQRALASGREQSLSLMESLLTDEGTRMYIERGVIGPAHLEPNPGLAGAMVDRVVARSRAARETETAVWP